LLLFLSAYRNFKIIFMSQRLEKVDALLHSLVSQFFEEKRDLFSPAFLTIKRVEVGSDLKRAKVWVSIFGNEDEEVVLKKLEKSRPELQHFIGRRITFKFNPVFSFKIDHSGELFERIERILKRSKK